MTPQEKMTFYTSLLEKSTYKELAAFLADLKNKDNAEYEYFWLMVWNDVLRWELARHKKSLAIFLAEKSNVDHLPEDRTRIVFTLSSLSKFDLTTINQSLAKQFGSSFRLLEKYDLNGKVFTWKQIALRAKEIVNGYYNHSYLVVSPYVDELMTYYKLNSAVKIEDIKRLRTLSEEITATIGSDLSANPQLTKYKDTMAKISELYRLSGRVKTDMEALQEATDFEEINFFVQTVRLVSLAKNFLYENKAPLSDLNAARYVLTKHCGSLELESYFSPEEFDRANKQLQPRLPSVAK